jgi:seryl-tRNA synthetase
MAKTLNTQDEGKKQSKKQEKREAKMLIEVEEARKEVKKAEQKLAKAQSNLEASRIRLQELEEGLVQICKKHSEQPEPPVVTAPAEQSYEHPEEIKVPDQGESYEDREAVEELHQSSLPPVEGRSDIAQ